MQQVIPDKIIIKINISIITAWLNNQQINNYSFESSILKLYKQTVGILFLHFNGYVEFDC
jgi:hypothetical protein